MRIANILSAIFSMFPLYSCGLTSDYQPINSEVQSAQEKIFLAGKIFKSSDGHQTIAFLPDQNKARIISLSHSQDVYYTLSEKGILSFNSVNGQQLEQQYEISWTYNPSVDTIQSNDMRNRLVQAGEIKAFGYRTDVFFDSYETKQVIRNRLFQKAVGEGCSIQILKETVISFSHNCKDLCWNHHTLWFQC